MVRRVLKWFMIILGVGIVLALFLSFAAYVIVLTPPVQEYVKTEVEYQLSELLVGKVTIGQMKTNLVTTIEASNIVAYDTGQTRDSTIIDHVQIDYVLPALLTKTIYIRSIRIDGGRIKLVMPEEGELRIPGIPLPSDTTEEEIADSVQPSEWQVAIGAIRAKGLEALYIDNKQNIRAHLENIAAVLHFPQIDSITAALESENGYIGSPWWEGAIDNVSIDGIINPPTIRIQQSVIEGTSTRITTNGTIPLDSGVWNLNTSIQSGFEPFVILDTLVPELGPSGQLFATASLEGTLESPRIALDLTLIGTRYNATHFDSVAVMVSYGNESTLQMQSKVYTDIGNLFAKGFIRIPGILTSPVLEAYGVEVDVNGFELEKVNRLIKIDTDLPRGNVTISAAASGSAFDRLPQQASLDVLVSGGAFNAASVKLDAVLKYGRYNVSSSWGENTMVATGTMYNTGQFDGTVQVQLQEPQLMTTQIFGERVNGSLSATAYIDGPLDSPTIKAFVTSPGLRWRGVEVDSIHAIASAGTDTIYIEQSLVVVDGAIDSVMEFVGIDSVGGRLHLVANVNGPLQNISSSVTIGGTNFYYKNFSVDSIQGTVTASGIDSIAWEPFLIVKNQSKLLLWGTLAGRERYTYNTKINQEIQYEGEWMPGGEMVVTGGLGDTFEMAVLVDSFVLSEVPSWVPIGDDVGGTLWADGIVRGIQSDFSGNVDLTITSPRYGTYEMTRLSTALEYTDSLLTTHATLLLNDRISELMVDAVMPVRPGDQFRIDTQRTVVPTITVVSDTLNLMGFDQVVSGFSAQGQSQITASLTYQNGEWILGGNVSANNAHIAYAPMAVSASDINLNTTFAGSIENPFITFMIETARANISGQDIDSTFITGVFRSDTVTVDTAFMVFTEGGYIGAEATIPLRMADSLIVESAAVPGIVFTIHQVPLQVVESMVPGLFVNDGFVQGKGKLIIDGGGFSSSGQLAITNGVFEYEGVETTIGPATASIVLSGDSVIIRTIQSEIGRGKVRGNGLIVVRPGGTPFLQFNVTGNDIELVMTDLIDANIQDVRLSFSTTDGEYLLRGRAELGTTRFIRDYEITDLIEIAQTAGVPSQRPNEFLQQTNLQLELALQENLYINMNLADLQMDGNLSIIGTAVEPGFAGTIEVVDGSIYYLDRGFVVQNGLIRFPDPLELNPNFDIIAETSIFASAPGTGQLEEYIITLSLSGDLEQPEVVLTSDPTLNKPDIISMLTLGAPINAIGSDLAGRIRALAQQELVGFGTRSLARLLNLDNITITGDAAGPELLFTKQVSRRLMLNYQTGLDNFSEQRITILYRIFSFLFLSGSTDPQGRANVKLKFRYTR